MLALVLSLVFVVGRSQTYQTPAVVRQSTLATLSADLKGVEWALLVVGLLQLQLPPSLPLLIFFVLFALCQLMMPSALLSLIHARSRQSVRDVQGAAGMLGRVCRCWHRCCSLQASILPAVASEFSAASLRVLTLDVVSLDSADARQFQVNTLPAFRIFKNGLPAAPPSNTPHAAPAGDYVSNYLGAAATWEIVLALRQTSLPPGPLLVKSADQLDDIIKARHGGCAWGADAVADRGTACSGRV